MNIPITNKIDCDSLNNVNYFHSHKSELIKKITVYALSVIAAISAVLIISGVLVGALVQPLLFGVIPLVGISLWSFRTSSKIGQVDNYPDLYKKYQNQPVEFFLKLMDGKKHPELQLLAESTENWNALIEIWFAYGKAERLYASLLEEIKIKNKIFI